jgi:hypothetical protein
MERRFKALVIVLCLALGAGACDSGSGGDNPLGSSSGSGNGSGGGGGGGATGISAAVLNNGVLATNGALTILNDVNANMTFGVSGVADPLAGTANSSRLQSAITGLSIDVSLGYCPYGTPNYGPTGCLSQMGQYPTTVQLSSSVLQFDLMMETPPSQLNDIWIYWGPDSCKFGCEIPLSLLSVGSWVHFSIPGNGGVATADGIVFSGPGTTNRGFLETGCKPVNPSVATLFQINLLPGAGAVVPTSVLLNNIQWTP